MSEIVRILSLLVFIAGFGLVTVAIAGTLVDPTGRGVWAGGRIAVLVIAMAMIMGPLLVWALA